MLKVKTLLPIDRASIRLLANPQATMSTARAVSVVTDVMAFSVEHGVELGVRVRASAKFGHVFVDVDGDCMLSVASVRALLAMIREWQSSTMIVEVVYDGRVVSHTFHTITDTHGEGVTNLDELRANLGAHVVEAITESLTAEDFPSLHLENDNA